MSDGSVHERFTNALAGLIEQVKRDSAVLAAILCGSLSHDTVWAKSDIDLVLVTIDDRKVEEAGLSLYADGVNVHASLLPRSEFRRLVEGSLSNSFMHSLLAKGRLLYTHDETITDLFNRLSSIGERDTRIQLLRSAANALPPVYKAHKWLITRRDPEYSALWILYAATPLAQVEVIGARQIAGREVILQALALNPQFFKLIYSDLLNSRTTLKAVRAALDAVDNYLSAKAPHVFGPVIDHLRDVGEARSSTEIEDHFKRNFGIEGITGVCEYLADQGLIGKVSTPVRLTRRSSVELQELAFVYRS